MIVKFSPAKANLFFRVLSKRPDGYHEVASIYTALNFGDVIFLRLHKEDLFCSNEKRLKDDTSNLCIRARERFRQATHILDPVAIDLEKKIPMGAGLGGGSSNAATVLWAMNELFQRPLALDQLISIGASIGSDVPFFFSKGFAYCTGRGEIIKELDFTFGESFWIAKPEEYFLATPEVYAQCKPNEVSCQDPMEIVQLYQRGEFVFVNDLEPAAFRIEPKLLQFKQQLYNLGFTKVVMTGSGSAFLCFGYVQYPRLPNTSFVFVRGIR